tara:strand:- start:21 stop:269 length:249 start_codon:yes stop_codon:yes gene_type:complete
MVFRDIFNMSYLGRMDSKLSTNRKTFLKRAGLAIAGVFAVSSTAGLNTRRNQASQCTTATQGTSNSAIARVRKAKGAIAYKA